MELHLISSVFNALRPKNINSSFIMLTPGDGTLWKKLPRALDEAIRGYDDDKQEKVKQLLAQGADPNLTTFYTSPALHLALTYHGKPDMPLVQLLLENSADINGRGIHEGRTPLQELAFAANFRDTVKARKPFMDAIEFLLAHGADPTLRGETEHRCGFDYGATASQIASETNFPEGRALLQRAEADWKKSDAVIAKRRATPGNTLGL